MTGIKKRAPQFRYAREAKPAEKAQIVPLDPSPTVPRHLTERDDDDSEEGSWLGCQSISVAAVRWGEEGWESEECEEECKFTDRRDEDSPSCT